MEKNRVEEILRQVRDLAAEYYVLTGKPLGVTGEVAEYHVANLLGLQLCYARRAGYDATEGNGPSAKKVQIKGRCLQPDKDRSPRMGLVDYAYEWDTLMLVLMDHRLEPTGIWELDREATEKAFPPEAGKSRTHRGPAIGKFTRLATQVWNA